MQLNNQHKWLSSESLNTEGDDAMKDDIYALILMVVLLIAGIITVGVYAKIDKKKTIRKVNSQWIAELDRRGLIDSNNEGSFRWRSGK